MMVPMGENVHDKPIVSDDNMERIYKHSNIHLESLKNYIQMNWMILSMMKTISKIYAKRLNVIGDIFLKV